MYIEKAVINYGSRFEVAADEAGMTVTHIDADGDGGNVALFFDTDTFAELVALARFLGWEGLE